MHENTTRAQFVIELEQLQDRDPATLSADLRASLECWRIEQLLQSSHSPEVGRKSRLTVWVGTFLDVASFVDVHGDVPRENNRKEQDAEEARLAFWLRYQRRRAIANDLSTYQRLSIESLPGFSWAPADESWDANFAAYEEFLNYERRAPRYRSTDRMERRLAAWAAKQRHALKQGRLEGARVQKLDTLSIRVLPTRRTPL